MAGYRGSIGFILGSKTRKMLVTHDADLLWHVCVRELWLMLYHYESIDAMRDAFANIQCIRPRKNAVVLDDSIKMRCACVADTSDDILRELADIAEKEEAEPDPDPTVTATATATATTKEEWMRWLSKCEHSFINMVTCGMMLRRSSTDDEFVDFEFLVDFNENKVLWTKNTVFSPTLTSSSAFASSSLALGMSLTESPRTWEVPFHEIMQFEDDMPRGTLTEIVEARRARFDRLFADYKALHTRRCAAEKVLALLPGERNIGAQANAILEDIQKEVVALLQNYHYFHHFIDDLNLMHHPSS